MANRTFKVYGQAYAEAGDVTAVLSVGGVEVFNGAVNDSTTDREGNPPDTSNLLFTYTLDEATTGNLAYSLAVSGGELCLGRTKYNGVTGLTIPQSWMDANIPDPTAISAEAQTYVANTIGESALGSDIYNAFIAGTLTNPTDEQNTAIIAANTNSTDFTVYGSDNDERSSAQIDGVALEGWDDATVNTNNWPIIPDGSTFTCTWNLDPSTVIDAE